MRTRRRAPRLIAAVLVAALSASVKPTASAQPAPAATPAPAQQADDLFLKGKALLKEGKKKEALAAYRAAFALRKSYDVAGNLGSLEVDLGLYRDAAEHIAYALSHYAASGTTSDQLNKAKQRFETARKEVCALRVAVNVAGAEVFVDGVSIGRAPIAEDVFVDAGTRKIEARLPSYVSAAKTVDAKKGATEEVKLDLAPEPVPTATATASAMATASATVETPPSHVPSYIAFGVGGAGLVLAAITGGLSIAKYGDVTKSCDGTACPASLRGEADTGKALAHVSTAGLVLAGVGAAVGVTLLLVPIGGKPAPTRAALTVGPTFVGVKGAF